jgi:Caspase domain
MRRRALIIRSGYDPPPGAHNAAQCIAQVLGARGFEVVRCEGPAATRRGILEAYDALTRGAASDDAFVIYYAGHGGLVINNTYTPGSLLPPCIQHICPTDFADTREDDFRGICALELSLKLAALTEIAPNTTVILECCFAALMSRAMSAGPGPGDAPVIRPTLTRVGLTRHFEGLRSLANSLQLPVGACAPRAVRVAASGQTELARPVSAPTDEKLAALGLELVRHDAWIGALSMALVDILTELGDARVAWRSIASALRARLLGAATGDRGSDRARAVLARHRRR